jgi:WD40 repeat protein
MSRSRSHRRGPPPIGEVIAVARHFEAPITALLTHGDGFVVAAGDGTVTFAPSELTTARSVAAHSGAILGSAIAGADVVTGGDDGRVVRTAPDGAASELWRSSGRWVDHVGASARGTLAWSSGKLVHVTMNGNDAPRELSHPTAIGGLAFAPSGHRLAVAHYGGVTVWDLSVSPPASRRLEWKGSHLNVTWSPDERFLVTAMQEGALHGWFLSDGADFAMRGYPMKPRSLSWSQTGEWLATSGAPEILLWPFNGRWGPIGGEPEVRAPRDIPVTVVACHSRQLYIAAGYQDGVVLIARHQDSRELTLRRATGAAVTALAWSADGRRIAYGTEDGEAAIVDLASVSGAQGPLH